jgi:hypothetical protein
MAKQDRRVEFISKWFGRAVDTDDSFDAFFSLWIALVVAAQRARTEYGSYPRENDTDRRKVLDYFSINKVEVLSALEQNAEGLSDLVRRRGTVHGNPIVDTGNPDLREKFRLLARHYRQGEKLPDEELIDYAGELINRIRNNVFHGTKIYDDRGDIALLKKVNPILTSILRECESL